MRWLQHGMAAWIFWGALVLSGSGQSLPAWLGKNDLPKPPDVGIRDNGGFFSRNSGALQRISDQLHKLEAAHGFQIYLLVEPVLIATSAPQWAAELQQSWLPEGNGLVVLFEADNCSLGFGRDVGGAPDESKPPGSVPTHETAAILARAREATDTDLAPEAYMEALMGNLVSEFTAYFERRTAPPPAGRSLRLGLLTVGALTLLALVAMAVALLARLPSMAGSRVFRFPAVTQPERLGAPCGGGNVSTRRFKTQ